MPADSDIRSIVESFIASATQPVVLDPGEEPLPLETENWNITDWNGRLVLQAWDARRNFVRKIISVKERRRDRIALVTERFPKTPGEMQIADLASANGADLRRRTSRIAFRDRFRLLLAREFPQWRAEDVSADPNLEQSLSPSYVRAYLHKGSAGIAVMAAPPDSADCSAVVPFGLIWLDYLRRRERTTAINRLLLYVPLHAERATSLRVACLDPAALTCELFAYDDRDRAGSIDITDAGNIESSLPPCRRPSSPNLEPHVPDLPAEVDRVVQSDGAISLRVHGLEFARWSKGKLSCGIGRKTICAPGTVSAMAREMIRLRSASAAGADRQHPLYTQYPEGWLESRILADPQSIDAGLRKTPIYGKVPTFHGPDRGVIDLLGVDASGRLTILELKATADLQLPFQALDYCLRVRKHLAAGDFERLGYFPGITISREPPRILLIAPALEFHSTSETVIASIAPHVDFTRIGLAADWRNELRVMFRLRGAERP